MVNRGRIVWHLAIRAVGQFGQLTTPMTMGILFPQLNLEVAVTHGKKMGSGGPPQACHSRLVGTNSLISQLFGETVTFRFEFRNLVVLFLECLTGRTLTRIETNFTVAVRAEFHNLLLVGGCDHEFGQFFIEVVEVGDFLDEDGFLASACHDGVSTSTARPIEKPYHTRNISVFDIHFISV